MSVTRRHLIQGAKGLALGAAFSASAATPAAATDAGVSAAPARPKIALPDRDNFVFEGVHLNAAFTHPIGLRTTEATTGYIQSRMRDAGRSWPSQNPRNAAVARFARLINAEPGEVAITPSTLEGENLIAAALGLGPGAGVVTDPFHYDAALAMYGELHRKGMPLTVVAPRDWRIDYDDLDRAIGPETRLVALSLVSSDTGYRHDLETVCEIAHRKGVLVYADIIQAVGAAPFDVKASGVDFCCAGLYKWLMGEFGAAFLYVRADRLPDLHRVQLGWRGVKSFTRHYMPFDAPGPVGGEWTLGAETANLFEVSTPDWSALATVTGSLDYIDDIGLEAIAAHRDPMLERLQAELPKAGFQPLTPRDHQGAAVVFAYQDAGPRFGDTLKATRIYTTLQKNKIRISPSVHNSMADIDALLGVLTARA